MTELFDILDYLGNKTGQQMERNIVHSHGYWHRTRHIHPINLQKQTHPKVMDYEIQDVSFLDSPLSVDDFDLNRKEVFGILEFNQHDLYDLFSHKVDRVKNRAGKKFINDVELIDFITEWTIDDFLPFTDNYFGKCVDIAKRIANGERIFLGI